jgi:hypothetical protein
MPCYPEFPFQFDSERYVCESCMMAKAIYVSFHGGQYFAAYPWQPEHPEDQFLGWARKCSCLCECAACGHIFKGADFMQYCKGCGAPLCESCYVCKGCEQQEKESAVEYCYECGHVFDGEKEDIHPCRGCGCSLCPCCMDLCSICRREQETVVVTRHPALIQYLLKHGIVSKDARVIAHASPEDIMGRRVVGVLPLHLAALAREVTEIPLALRPEHRGKELSLDELEEIAQPPRTYVIDRVDD